MEAQYKRLGDILEAQGLISAEQLKTALDIQEVKGLPLGRILTQQRFISEEALAKALAFQKNLSQVDLFDYDVNLHAASLVNEEIARRYTLIPIDFDEGRLVVAVANPLDVHAIDSVQMITGLKITLVVATPSGIDDAISRYMTGPAQIQETVDEVARMREVDAPPPAGLFVDEEVPVVKLANTILTQAVRERASDVHIECGESVIRVRYRIDGVLREAMSLPDHLKGLLVSRFKIMSAIDISERRRPQDGRMSLKIEGKEVQFRVATLPGVYGESVVLRVLTGGKALIKLEALGIDEKLLSLYRRAFNRSYGGALVTGPTGSGKTTTLYSMLNELNSPEKKIITIEDPVEYCLESITQIQINRKAGLDFANGLRAIVRADPDILMIGEIRDLETAQISVRAALTGHLVLSSIHTNDAASAITRLIDMGIDPFIVTSSIKCVLAQRLARILCPHCKQPVEYTRARLAAFEVHIGADSRTFYESGGCRKCQNTGYQGRIGIFELLIVDDEINKLAVSGASSTEIKKSAVSAGMRTLYGDGILKADRGLVSIDEVRRVVT
ncbi:MAG: ATPase, T2SS/T4P/T4SS family [Actinomycetota bacterium]|nr:ATPase, T2SS/T4P/T4SS family [Actinomycetota bacterium]